MHVYQYVFICIHVYEPSGLCPQHAQAGEIEAEVLDIVQRGKDLRQVGIPASLACGANLGPHSATWKLGGLSKSVQSWGSLGLDW